MSLAYPISLIDFVVQDTATRDQLVWSDAGQHLLDDLSVERFIASECMQTAPTTGIAIL